MKTTKRLSSTDKCECGNALVSTSDGLYCDKCNTYEPLEEEMCENCGEPLKAARVVWLELSQTDSRYWINLPADHESQGGFPFGRTCASKIAADGPL